MWREETHGAMTLSSDLPDRKSAILQAAVRHFSTHGFEGASLRKIAADAGVSLTLLDHHFGAKPLLYDAVLLAAAKALAGRLDALRRAFHEAPPAGLQQLAAAWIAASIACWSTSDGMRLSQLAFQREARRRCAALDEVLSATQREFGSLVMRLDPRWDVHASGIALTFVEEIVHGEICRDDRDTGATVDERRAMLVDFVTGGLRELAEGLRQPAADGAAGADPA